MLLSLLPNIVLPQTNPAATTTTITSSVSDTNKSLAKLRRRKSRTHQTSQAGIPRSRSAAGNQSSHRARCTAPGSSLSCSAYSQLHLFAAGLRCRDLTAGRQLFEVVGDLTAANQMFGIGLLVRSVGHSALTPVVVPGSQAPRVALAWRPGVQLEASEGPGKA